MPVTMWNLSKEVFPSNDKIFFLYIYSKKGIKVNVDQIDNLRHMQEKKKNDNDNQYPEISIHAHINIKHVSILLFIYP